MSRKPNRRVGEHYVIGVDLGVAMQPTAIAVVKQDVVDMIRRGQEVSSIQLVYLERLPLDASYAAAIEAVKRILEEVRDKEQDSWRGKPRTDVVVDITGKRVSVDSDVEVSVNFLDVVDVFGDDIAGGDEDGGSPLGFAFKRFSR